MVSIYNCRFCVELHTKKALAAVMINPSGSPKPLFNVVETFKDGIPNA